MRVTPLNTAYGRNLTPKNQLNFGYFDKHGTKEAKKEELAILDLLPKLDEDQIKLLRNHSAVTIKRDGSRAYGVLNEDYKNANLFNSLGGGKSPIESLRKRMYRLDNLQNNESFARFWSCFAHCVYLEIKPSLDNSADEYEEPYDRIGVPWEYYKN